MSVLIKGMSLTKENFMAQLYLICDKDGNWYAVDTTNKDLYKLIEVEEPHGRLIDADEIEMPCLETTADQKWMEIAIKSAPTVIEAEGSEE